MKVQITRFASVALTLIGLTVALYLVSRLIILDGYTRLEDQQVRDRVQMAKDTVARNLGVHERLARDWSAWDETYAFIQDHNQHFIDANLVDATFRDLDVNLIALVNAAGHLVYARAFDLQANKAMPLPPGLHPYLVPPSPLLVHAGMTTSNSGILLLPTTTMLVVSNPIVTTDSRGPIRGTIIMGRLLDRDEVQRISNTLHAKVLVRRLDDRSLTEDYRDAQQQLTDPSAMCVLPINRDAVAGYGLLNDIFGKPALLVKVISSRPVYQHAQVTLNYFLAALLSLSLLFGVIIHGVLAALETAQRELRKKEALRESEEQYRRLVELSPDGVFIFHREECVFVNAAGVHLLNASRPGEVLGRSLRSVFAANAWESAEQHLEDFQVHYPALRIETQLLRLNASPLEVEIAFTNLIYQDAPAVQVFVHDITDRKEAEERLKSLAFYDALTGLPNRLLSRDRLDQALVRAHRDRSVVAVMLLDLDGFKEINDSYGHEAGDHVLQEAAQRLTDCIRESDTVARIGGDEFLLLLQDSTDQAGLEATAQRILETFAVPFSVGEYALTVTTSIGIKMVAPDTNETATSVVKSADAAMYCAKARGKNTYYFAKADTRHTPREREPA